MKLKFKTSPGFTLIELLIVISIIGILAALSLVSFTGSQRQTRDTQRKSDLTQYRTSLEVYASKTGGIYPSRSTIVNASSILCSTDLGLTSCPEDPGNSKDPSTYTYRYVSDGTGGGTVTGTKYVLWTKLENISSYWVVCSTGKSGAVASGSWSNPSLGVCPI